jgi:hypothetical protein
MQCRHFGIKELIHPKIYTRYGDTAWRFLDPKILTVIDTLRDRYGPIVINDWGWGGNLRNCGLRLPDGSVGAYMSMHKLGGAVDVHFKSVGMREVFEDIMSNELHWYTRGLRRIENLVHTPTWMHLDSANTPEVGRIVVFNI